MTDNIAIYKKRIAALIFMSASPVLAVAPFLIGMAGSAITPGCTNEANCGWAVLPWFMFLTIPAAFVFFVLGLARFLATLAKKLTKTSDPTPEERSLRRYYFGWMSTASGPLLLALAGVLALFAGPVETCDAQDTCTQTANGAVAGALAIAAPILLVASWLYLLGIAIRNRLDKNASGS